MKTKFALITACLLLSTICFPAYAQGTAFTYQGRLQNNGSPASGSYNLTFWLFNVNSGGTAEAGPVITNGVIITNGLFTVTLDFGSGVWNGGTNWLEIGVETNGGGSFTTLVPRQKLTPAPYAIFAQGVNAAGISGTLPAANLNGTYGGAVNFNNGANSFDGSFYGDFYGASFIGGNFTGDFIGNGSGLSGVWLTTGNSGTTAGANFLGTTDNQPLELHVYGSRAFRLEPTPNTGNVSGAVNVIGGSSANLVMPGIHGATIAGGGAPFYFGGNTENLVAADFGTIGGGVNNEIQSNSYESTISGGNDNSIQPGAFRSTVGGGWFNGIQANAPQSFIGGGFGNRIFGDTVPNGDSVIAGGNANAILTNADFSAIGGGLYNVINGDTNDFGTGVIAGGDANVINSNSWNSFIGGGQQNSIGSSSDHSFVGGGQNNIVNSPFSVIGGGYFNVVQNGLGTSVIGGGQNNNVVAPWAVIAGGYFNTNAGWVSFIGAGDYNDVQASAIYSVIGGGFRNTTGGIGAVVGGGGYDGSTFAGNQTYANASAIGGGLGNSIQIASPYSTIGGGAYNSIQFFATNATIAGGNVNVIQPNANDAFIGGGEFNNIQSYSANATIAGGTGNVIQTNDYASTIGGGLGNQIQSSTFANTVVASTIAGGFDDLIQTNAFNGTIGGGLFNLVGNQEAVIGGGGYNTNNSYFGTIPGGYENVAAGSFSFAAGNRAQALYSGDFVWADSQNTNFAATSTDQVSFRCQGGVRFTSGGSTADQTVSWTPGSASWSFSSDHNLKDRFEKIDLASVLDRVSQLPIAEWSYKGYPQRHIGAMAQDFHALFPLNNDDKSLNDADLHGVELAAIQGLNQKLDKKDAEIEQLKQSIAQLQALVAQLAKAQSK